MDKPGRKGGGIWLGLGGRAPAPRVCAPASRGDFPRCQAPVSKGRFCRDRSIGISLLGSHGGGGRNKWLVIVVGEQDMANSDHEEADTRMVLHVIDAPERGAKKILICMVDTDVI